MYKGSSDAWKKYEHHLQPLLAGRRSIAPPDTIEQKASK
jgi:hypothetical protein